MTEKACTKCGEVKPLDDFPNDHRLRSGKSSQCRDCHAIRSARSYQANREARIERSKQWQRDHPDAAKNRIPKKIRESALVRELRERKAANAAHRRSVQKTWEASNREALNAQSRARYSENESIREQSRTRTTRWKETNPERHRELKREQSRRRRAKLKAIAALTDHEWSRILDAYDHRCAYCGRRRTLTKDHVIAVAAGGEDTISNVVPACAECNSRKGSGPAPRMMPPLRPELIG